jgi:HEAT repeats/Putative zinc-finger
MICERAKEQMAEYLSGGLEGGTREKFVEHLEQCGRCRSEVEELGALWRGLEFLPAPEPGVAVRQRFSEMLEAYRFGLEQKERKPRAFAFVWWQLAAAAGLLVVGSAVGIAVGRNGASSQVASAPVANTEVRQLQAEVESMRQLVTLSLLQQQSASARLRGVTYSYQMEKPDPQVVNALLFAVNHDSNVNVRLSAVDALQKYVANPETGKALVDGLATQDSPLVQIALIDMLVQANDGNVALVLRKLAADGQSNPAVRQRAEWGLQKLGAA